MKPKLLFICFVTSIIAMMITAYYAVGVGEQLKISYEKQGKQFKEITTAAAQVISYAKRAEGHLFIYLMLHDPIDKEKYPKRIKSLHENIDILRKTSDNPKAKAIIDQIIANTGENLSMGNSLIFHHDREMKESGKFHFATYRKQIKKLHERFSTIRRLGVKLTAFLIKSEDTIRAEAYARAKQLRLYLLLFVALAACFAIYTGYVLSKMSSSLSKEIAVRMESEKMLEDERNKLIKALSQVKVLSGLIPICSSCKKIRDDQGYWNQVETYISQHSDAQLSHSLCPDCAQKLYPEIFAKDQDQTC